jgi:hypothetical protein
MEQGGINEHIVTILYSLATGLEEDTLELC